MGMQTYRFETIVKKDGTLAIKNLPFSAGEKVEVIVRRQAATSEMTKKYSLRGKPFRFVEPFTRVSEDDWEVLK